MEWVIDGESEGANYMKWTRATANRMRLTEWMRKLIPQVKWCVSNERAVADLQWRRYRWSSIAFAAINNNRRGVGSIRVDWTHIKLCMGIRLAACENCSNNRTSNFYIAWSEKVIPCLFLFCDNFYKRTPILTIFNCYNKKCIEVVL